MNFWKRLFRKETPEKPIAQPDSMEDEILRLDAIEAIDPKTKKLVYWRTLHPLVQAYWVNRVDWNLEKELPITESDASSVFHRWGYPVSHYTFDKTPRQAELMQQYDQCKEKLWQQAKEASQRFVQLDEEAKNQKEQAWQAYWEHYQTLPRQLQCLVGWELAKRGGSQGKSGFHGMMDTAAPVPFAPCGWASYRDPQWGAMEGVAFRIQRACFDNRKPLLYYLDDDGWPEIEREKTALKIIRRYSSGITGVRVERRRCRDWYGNEKENRVVLFELDPAEVKPSILLSGQTVPTRELGEYVFVLPRAGEFHCLLGEVRDGEMIPLHKDDFCMK